MRRDEEEEGEGEEKEEEEEVILMNYRGLRKYDKEVGENEKGEK